MEREFSFFSMTHFIAICTALALLVGCSGEFVAETLVYSASEIEEVTIPADEASQNKVIEETDYYQVFENNCLYSYLIYDKNGNVVASADNLTSQPQFTFTDRSFLRVVTQAGTGIGTQSGFYYDVEKNLRSPVYQSILSQQGNLVAYATQSSIIVRDIFDTSGFYRELSEFSTPFSEVAFPFLSAVFADDGSYICVTYLGGKDYVEVSEIFELPT